MTSSLRRIAEQLMQSGGHENTLDYLWNRLMQLMSCALHGEKIYHFENITNHLTQAYNLVSSLLVESEIGNCGLCYSNNAGRPKFLILKETLPLFLEYNSSYKEIATLFNVSKRTIQRILHEYQLYKEKYNHISDDELEELVQKILLDFPNSGVRRMKGYLQAKGLNIQWERIRSALWKLDPEGMILRSVNSNIIHRRKYSVARTLFLGHIDGNHKLITKPVQFYCYIWRRFKIMVYHLRSGQIMELKIISLPCLWRIVTMNWTVVAWFVCWFY